MVGMTFHKGKTGQWDVLKTLQNQPSGLRPNAQQIAEQMGCSVNTIRRSLVKLYPKYIGRKNIQPPKQTRRYVYWAKENGEKL